MLGKPKRRTNVFEKKNCMTTLVLTHEGSTGTALPLSVQVQMSGLCSTRDISLTDGAGLVSPEPESADHPTVPYNTQAMPQVRDTIPNHFIKPPI